MSARKLHFNLLVWAGLWLAALIWAVNMQLGQILPYTDCRSQLHISAITSFVGAALTAMSGLVSWQSARQPAGEAHAQREITGFGSGVSALSACIFTFALLMQGAASLVLTGCER